MPFSINGIGTRLCGDGAPIHWVEHRFLSFQNVQRADHDAVECFVFLLLPIIPLKPVHTFGWNGASFHAVPLRWSAGLVLGSMLQIYAIVLIMGGCLTAAFAMTMDEGSLKVGAIGLGLAGLGVACIAAIRRRERRTRDVRLVLGRHSAGTSDPAMWTPDLLGQLGERAIADGVAALDRSQFSEAMLVARIAVGHGRPEGETLTDQVLANPTVAAALPALRKQPWRRDELLRQAF